MPLQRSEPRAFLCSVSAGQDVLQGQRQSGLLGDLGEPTWGE